MPALRRENHTGKKLFHASSFVAINPPERVRSSLLKVVPPQ